MVSKSRLEPIVQTTALRPGINPSLLMSVPVSVAANMNSTEPTDKIARIRSGVVDNIDTSVITLVTQRVNSRKVIAK
ncbi:hypothetical protein D3C80_1778110 [compost metagenome]